MPAIENVVFDFLLASQTAAADGTILKLASLMRDIHEPIPDAVSLGIRISNSAADYAPKRGGNPDDYLGEHDVELIMIFFSEVLGTDVRDGNARAAARDGAADLARAVATLFFLDPSMMGQVCDSRVLRRVSGYKQGAGLVNPFDEDQRASGRVFAVINFGLVFNETGQNDNL